MSGLIGLAAGALAYWFAKETGRHEIASGDAEDLADRFEAAEPNPLSDDQHATVFDLRDAVIGRGQAEAQVAAQVAVARAAGVSWAVIATVLGTSRQGAQQRYG